MAMQVISVMDGLQFVFQRPNHGTRCRGAVHPNGCNPPPLHMCGDNRLLHETSDHRHRCGLHPPYACYIGDALRYLEMTMEGKQWTATLYSDLFAIEHNRRRMGPQAGPPRPQR